MELQWLCVNALSLLIDCGVDRASLPAWTIIPFDVSRINKWTFQAGFLGISLQDVNLNLLLYFFEGGSVIGELGLQGVHSAPRGRF